MTAPFTSDTTPTPVQGGVAADISVVPAIDFDDFKAQYNRPNNLSDNRPEIFTDYQIVHHYEWDRHTYMLGVTSPAGFSAGSAAFCQLAAPTLLWIADWTAARYNRQPTVPDPTLVQNTGYDGSEWVLLDKHYETPKLVLAADGQSQLYRISGTYVYGRRNPSADTLDDVRFPRAPWLKDNFDRTMPSNTGLVEQNLIDGNGSTAFFVQGDFFPPDDPPPPDA